MNKLQKINGEEIVMTSLEFSKLTGKSHNETLMTLDRLNETFIKVGKKEIFFGTNKGKNGGRQRRTANLTKYQCEAAAMRMSPELQLVVLDRLKELEKKLESAPTILPKDLPSAYLELARIEQEKLELKEKNVEFFLNDRKQNGSIGGNTRRKNHYRKERDTLQVKLNKSSEYSTVRRISGKTGLNYKWKELKLSSERLGLEIIKIPDELYGEVNAYHKDVWLDVYGEEI